MIHVIGHAAIDHIITCDYFPKVGKTAHAKEYRKTFGGAAANAAVAFAKLGQKASLVSMLGDDFAQSGYKAHLGKLGIDLSKSFHFEGLNQPSAFAFNTKGEWICYFSLGVSEKFATAEPPSLEGDFHITCCHPNFAKGVAQLAKGKVSFDPGQDWHTFSKTDFEDIFSHVDYFFSNKEEFENIGWSLDKLFKAGVKVAVVSDGAKGSTIFTPKEKIPIPIFKTKIVDQTGCGDSYRAAFLTGLKRGLSLKDSGLLASAVASFVIEKQGPQEGLPTFEQAMERAELLKKAVK